MIHLRWCCIVGVFLLGSFSPAIPQGREDKASLLTKEERQWLSEHPVIRLVPESEYPPFTFIDSEGMHRGISADYAKRLEKILGFEFKLIKAANLAVNLEKVRKGHVDVLTSLKATPQRSTYLNFTKPYVRVPTAIIVRKREDRHLNLDNMEGMTIAVGEGYGIQSYLEENYSFLNLVPLPNDLIGLKKVSFDEVDAIVMDLASASFFIEREGIGNLRVAGDVDYTYDLRIASRKDWPLLNQILGKGLAQITEKERDAIYKKWVHLQFGTSIAWKYILRPFSIGLGCVILIIAGILLWNRSLRKEIAQRARAETAVQKSEESYRTLVANIPGIVYRSKNDPDWTVVFISDGIEATSGYPASEFVGNRVRSYSSIMHPDDSERVWQTVQDALKQGEPYEIEYRINNANGNIHWMLERGQGVIGKDGQLDYLDGALFDITRRRHAEEKLRKHSDHLEDLVSKRTKDLEQKALELEKANLRLQEADSHKTVFLASVSHELRTPLNAIIGFTGIILQGMAGEINEEQKKQLRIVKSSADTLMSLVQNVLDIAEIEAEREKPSLEEFALDDIVKETLESFLPLLKEKGLNFTENVPDGITIMSDRRRIKQVLMNLVGNAVKFTDEGSVKVAANILDNENIEMRISDTGVGIREADIHRLFQPFHKIDITHKKSQEGTGLGLYLTQRLADLLEGDVSVKSEFGKGSEFIFTVPRKPDI